jgi:hypothetical protein
MSHLFQQVMHQLNEIQNSLNLMHNVLSLNELWKEYTKPKQNMTKTFCLDSQKIGMMGYACYCLL